MTDLTLDLDTPADDMTQDQLAELAFTEVRTDLADDFDATVDTVENVTTTRAPQGDLTRTLRELSYMTYGTDAKRSDFIHEAMVRGVNKTTAGVCWAAGRAKAAAEQMADEAYNGWMSGQLTTTLTV